MLRLNHSFLGLLLAFAVIGLYLIAINVPSGPEQVLLKDYSISHSTDQFFTTICYVIPNSGNVKITVVSEAGFAMREIENGYVEAGIYQKPLENKSLPSGKYTVVLTADHQTKKDVLLINY